MLQEMFAELGLSPTTEQIYERLLRYGPASARQLAENLGIPRPSVYDHTKTLLEKDLVTELERNSIKVFAVSDYQKLPQLLERKIEELEAGKTALKELLPNIAIQTEHLEPRVKFYTGTEGVKQVLNDMLWHSNTDTLTMWPSQEMMNVLGPEYLKNLNRKRILRNISIRGIWPRNSGLSFKDYPFMGVGKGFLRELREAPPGMSWNMSYWLYGDKVAFISSKGETFGFVVQSQDFVGLLRTQFEVLWPLCKSIEAQPQYTDGFLKEIGKK